MNTEKIYKKLQQSGMTAEEFYKNARYIFSLLPTVEQAMKNIERQMKQRRTNG